jgi:hypothetical protein
VAGHRLAAVGKLALRIAHCPAASSARTHACVHSQSRLHDDRHASDAVQVAHVVLAVRAHVCKQGHLRGGGGRVSRATEHPYDFRQVLY